MGTVAVAINIATRQCRYSKVSKVEHGGLSFGLCSPLLVNMLLADTYCEHVVSHPEGHPVDCVRKIRRVGRLQLLRAL